MTGLNGIGGGKYNYNVNGIKPKTVQNNEAETRAAGQAAAPQTKTVSAEETLAFLGAQGSPIIEKKEQPAAETVSSKRTIQVSKYVDAEAAKRIAASVSAFTGAIDNIKDQLGADDSEFKGLSDKAKTELALAAFTKEFLPE